VTRLDLAVEPLELQAFSGTLNRFRALFQKWNKAINLSAARTDQDIEDHIIDCLHVIPHLRSARASASDPLRVLDVGSGGGLPSVIAAICIPDAVITALEPVHKKHAFLRTAARELDLPNLEPLAERLDDHARHDYDAAMSRATFDLPDWLALGLTRVRPGGVVLGFEATPRSDLPAACERFPYPFERKARAIIRLQRSA
jgi:16S rRNA (guanine527-N7)-methyltransferase